MKIKTFAVRLLLFCSVVAATFGVGSAATDWPMTGGNPQHTNFTPDSPAPPYKIGWVADFSPEQIYSAQAVIAAGRVYQTTLNGNLYALDAATGKRLWHFKAGECIWGAPAVGTAKYGGEGLVFVACWDGLVYGLDVATGKEKWRLDTGEPISASLTLADNTLFLGTRRGTMLAISTEGKLKWKQPVSWHVYSTASYDAGKVFVVSEDMFVHCLDAATGKPIWKSEKVYGLVFREFYPVITQGKVLVALTPAMFYGGNDWAPFAYKRPEVEKACLEANKAHGMLLADGKLPPEFEDEQQKLIKFFEQHPDLQSFYVLNQSDGKQAEVPPHRYCSAGLQNVAGPPAICADGTVVMPNFVFRTSLTRYDLARNRWVDILFEAGTTNNDESDFISVGGTRVFSKNTMRKNVAMDLTTRKVDELLWHVRPQAERVSVLPPTDRPMKPLSPRRLGEADWHGEPVGMMPPPIYGNQFFWMRQLPRLVAMEGAGQ